MMDRCNFKSYGPLRSTPTRIAPIEQMLQTKRQSKLEVTLPKLKCLELEPTPTAKELDDESN